MLLTAPLPIINIIIEEAGHESWNNVLQTCHFLRGITLDIIARYVQQQ